MEMKSMKMGKADAEKMLPTSSKIDTPAYPYGLQLELNDSVMKKLGMKELPEAGETLMLHAKITVSRSSQTDTKDGGKQQSVSLQITDMCICEPAEMKDMAQKIYEE